MLEDTLLLHQVPPYQKTTKRKPVATSKYYFFDVGVANYLINRRSLLPGSPEFGQALEHLVLLELKAYLDYSRLDWPLTFWRSQTRLEVDFVIADQVAIEVKAGNASSSEDFKGLRALAEEIKLKKKIVITHQARFRQTEDGIEVYSLQEFLKKLWTGEIIT